MANNGEQQLLYSLRSPTTPLPDKLALASSSLSTGNPSTGSALPQLIRDWLLDTLFKLVRSSSTTTEQALLNGQLWELLNSTTHLTRTASTPTPALPIYVAFIQVYSKSSVQEEQLLRDATNVWSKLAANAMRKVTVDAVLDSYEKLVKTSLGVYQSGAEEVRNHWEELAVIWLKAIKSVFVEAAKGGKKVTSHTLTLLPSLIPLLDLLPPTSPLRSTLLQTVQLSLFNVDNLRRGLARESYASGAASTPQPSNSSATTADSELLASLSSLPKDLETSLYAALPAFTNIYLTSLYVNSSLLFPLPAKATFPTPSAQKSALEVLGLGKRRELAGRWIKGVVELIQWKSGAQNESEKEKAEALARVLEEVEKGDLYRSGQATEVWEGLLPSVVEGAVERLEGIAVEDGSKRDAVIEVLSSVHRLEYESLERELPRILSILARTPSPTLDASPSSSTFLSLLLTHHSRSLTMPTLLSLLSDALAFSPYTAPNNLLTRFSFTRQLGQSINGMLSSSTSIRSTWENLLSPMTSILSPSDSMSIDQDGAANPSPTKKRKLSSTTTSGEPTAVLPAAARVRLLTTFISHLPTPALSNLVQNFKSFSEEIVDSSLKDFVKSANSSSLLNEEQVEGTPSKKSKKSKRKSIGSAVSNESSEPTVVLGIELFEARYAIVSRLASTGLLPKRGEEDDWVSIKKSRRDGLREVVEKGSKEAVIVSARLLLQQLELAADSNLEDSSLILDAILARLGSSSPSANWSGYLRGMKTEEVSLALWEMISRRWMSVFESLSSEEQIKKLVAMIAGCLEGAETYSSRDEITRRLLKRADFWELSSLQAQLRPALLNLVSLPSLVAPSSLLSLISDNTPSKNSTALRSISTETLLLTSRTFSCLASFVPLEYLGRDYRLQLAEKALSLDLWISAGEVDIASVEREKAQAELRRFVGYMGSVVDKAPQVLSLLVRQTLPGAKSATLSLYRSLIQTSLSTFSDSKSPAELLSFLEAFGEKPLADLSKRAKKDATLSQGLTCEESAYVLLLELVATNLGDISKAPTELSEAIRASFKSALKPFVKALATVTAARSTMDVFVLGDLLEATRSVWITKDWLAGSGGASDDQDLVCAEFTQTALSSAISQITSSASKPSALSACLSLLDLLSYRIKRLRSLSIEEKIDTQPFETLIASQVLFRRSFGVTASTVLDSNLIKATAAATLREYTVALEGISSAVSSAVLANNLEASMSSLQASLSTAMILLRDGPEGSVKLSSGALSELLRHLSLLVESVATKPDQEEEATKAYLLVATFLDGICADRPMLLSRLNVSSVLSLVSRILQPSPTVVPALSSTVASESASLLLRTLASTVGHIVRHRKDHVVPLFPQLVSTLSAFLSILRRAGYGSTGSVASIEDGGGDTGIVFGQRAEREARATFPAWVWRGGAKGINKPEAAAVGRLLGSLTAKTTAIQHKNSKQSSKTEEGGPSSVSTGTTTSLTAPLSKHAPFLLLAYLRACVHPTCPIPSTLRGELQGGWFEVMDSMGKWEREALMKGFLGEDEEAERGVLRDLWKSWEKERYRG
ncbi:Urb2 domain-containing protein [Sporobolomyces salmoneus]|uniref:Urb2 domain-containing protein n=1 Tax=Sporobolomyces salmoneus TaxID=183962 RepID=UPI00317A8B2D